MFVSVLMHHCELCHSMAHSGVLQNSTGGSRLADPRRENLKSLSCFLCCGARHGAACCTLLQQILALDVILVSQCQPVSCLFSRWARRCSEAGPCTQCGRVLQLSQDERGLDGSPFNITFSQLLHRYWTFLHRGSI